jgi:hypothetical protein
MACFGSKTPHKTNWAQNGHPLKKGTTMEKIQENIPEETFDATAVYRTRLELLHRRVNLLEGIDKVLMIMFLNNGNSFRQMARLTGDCEKKIARRIQTITKRLIDDTYVQCLRNRKELTRCEMKIAKDSFILGMSLRKIARKQKTTEHRIRKTLEKIRLIINDQT